MKSLFNSRKFYRISAIGLEKPVVTECTCEQVVAAYQQELIAETTGRCGAIVTDSMSIVTTGGEGQNEEKWWFEAFSTSPECTLVNTHCVQHEDQFSQVSDYRLFLSEISLLRRFRKFSSLVPRVNSIVVLPENLASDFVCCMQEREVLTRKRRQFNFFIRLFDSLSNENDVEGLYSELAIEQFN